MAGCSDEINARTDLVRNEGLDCMNFELAHLWCSLVVG